MSYLGSLESSYSPYLMPPWSSPGGWAWVYHILHGGGELLLDLAMHSPCKESRGFGSTGWCMLKLLAPVVESPALLTAEPAPKV